MKTKISFLVLVFSFILTVHPIFLCWSQSNQDQDTRKRIESYVSAFNNGEEAMRTCLQENISQASLENRPVDIRLSVYRQMKDNMGEITLNKIEANNPSSVSALIKTTKGEWFIFQFELESEPPYKIVGIRIESSDEPDLVDEPKIKEMNALQQIVKLLDEQSKIDALSGAVLIAKNGKPIFQRAYGLASKEFKVLNKVDTKFNLGSINKIFTQIAIGQLFEEGKVTFGDPIAKYLPEYPNRIASDKVTIRHLLDMTSGIGDFFGEKFENTPKDKFRENGDFLPMFANDSLLFEPGTKNQYSNGGYIVLGMIIEKVSGQNYYDYVKEKIFKPAGMLNTDSYEADVPVTNLAEGYSRESSNQPWKKNIYTRPARGSSAGGGYSTVEDLLKFTVALKQNLFFKKAETWRVLRGEPVKAIVPGSGGMGIFGGAPGINSGIETEIGNGYRAIVMSNYDPPSASDAMKKIRGILKRIK
jgi:CubicO group peptidase (beta-lactamase class C family)